MPFEMVIGKKYRVWRCPVQDLDPEAIFLVKFVNWSEQTGVTPSGVSLLDETNMFFEIRELVLTEQAVIESEFQDSQAQSHPKQGPRSPRVARRR